MRKLTLLLIPLALVAQDDINKLMRDVDALASAGKYTEAEPLLVKALAAEDARPEGEHPRLVPLLDALGSVYRAEGRNDQAEVAYSRALAEIEKSAGPMSLELIPHLKLLGHTYAGLKRNTDAEKQFLRVISIREKAN